MAAATIVRSTVIGDIRCVLGTYAFDSSYPTGGEAFTPATVGLTAINFALFSPTSGYTFEFDHTNNKVIAYQNASHAHDILLKGGQASSTTTNTSWYSSDIFGKEAATDKTIAGSASATKGGVMASTALA